MRTAFRPIEKDPLFARACAAGSTLRRIDRAEITAKDGGKSIWHQGRDLIELYSFEDASGAIVRQELLFFGLAVEYRQQHGFRTGSMDTSERSKTGVARAELLAYDPKPSQRVIELAGRLLRAAKRDFYTQHLLKQLNELMNTRFMQPETQIFDLGHWKDRLKKRGNKAGVKRRFWHVVPFPFVLYVSLGVLLGIVIMLIILLFVVGRHH